MLFCELTNKTLRERMLYLFIIGRMDQAADEVIFDAINQCYRCHDLDKGAYQSAIVMFRSIIAINLINKFEKHLSSQLFTVLEEKHQESFVWLMQTLDPLNKQYDDLMRLAKIGLRPFRFHGLVAISLRNPREGAA